MLTSPSSSKQQQMRKSGPKTTTNKRDTRSRLTAKLEQIKEGNNPIQTPNNASAPKDMPEDDGFGFEDVIVGDADGSERDDRRDTV